MQRAPATAAQEECKAMESEGCMLTRKSEILGTWKKPWTGAKSSVVAPLPPCAMAAGVTSQA